MGVVIAIDGPAGAGKSTVARRLASRLGFTYVDSGAMYRAVALLALRQHIELSDRQRIEQLGKAASIVFEPTASCVLLNGEDVTEAIRTPEISAAASVIATYPGLRRALVEKQREMASRYNLIMEGRDIGSVVFPHADVKVFLDADPEERVRRRRAAAGESAEQIRSRDLRDRTRSESPLVQAPDAIYLNSTELTPEQVEEAILKVVRTRIANGKGSS